MKLDYTDYSFGIAQGCCKVSEGCEHCYAEEDAQDWGLNVGGVPLWGPDAPRKVHGEKHWAAPVKWNEEASVWKPSAHEGKKHPIVFSSPMCDVFEDHPTIDGERVKLWQLIKATPNLDWHICTKRAANVEKNLPWGKNETPWPNVWISIDVENDERAKERLPVLASLNVAVRGAHLEPLLGPVPTLAQYVSQLDWVLVGGESRDNDPPAARRMEVDWVREVKTICDEASVPFFFKQWGSWKPYSVNADGSLVWLAKRRCEHPKGNEFLRKVWHPWPVPKVGKSR